MTSSKSFLGVALVLLGLSYCPNALGQRTDGVDFREAEEYLQAGISYYGSGEYEKAVEALKRAIQLDSTRADAHYHLGMAYSSLGRYKEAVVAYRLATRKKPDYAAAHFNLGHAYSNLKQYGRAVKAFKQAIKYGPDNLDAYFALATAYFDGGKDELAIATYEEAIRRDPDNPYAYFNLGLFYFPIGPHARAVDAFTQAITRDPRYSEAYYHRSIAYLLMGRGDSAASDAETYIALKGWRADHSLVMAIVGHFGQMQARRETSARKFLEDALRQADSKSWPFPVIEYLFGEVPAEVLLKKAQDVNQRVEARAFIGMDLSIKGEQKAALEHLKWVKNHSSWGSMMYALAVSQIERIKASSAVSPGR